MNIYPTKSLNISLNCPALHIAATASVIFDGLYLPAWKACYIYPVQQTMQCYTLATEGQFSIILWFRKMQSVKRSRLQLNLGYLLSSWFVWGAIAQPISVVIL